MYENIGSVRGNFERCFDGHKSQPLPDKKFRYFCSLLSVQSTFQEGGIAGLNFSKNREEQNTINI